MNTPAKKSKRREPRGGAKAKKPAPVEEVEPEPELPLDPAAQALALKRIQVRSHGGLSPARPRLGQLVQSLAGLRAPPPRVGVCGRASRPTHSIALPVLLFLLPVALLPLLLLPLLVLVPPPSPSPPPPPPRQHRAFDNPGNGGLEKLCKLNGWSEEVFARDAQVGACSVTAALLRSQNKTVARAVSQTWVVGSGDGSGSAALSCDADVLWNVAQDLAMVELYWGNWKRLPECMHHFTGMELLQISNQGITALTHLESCCSYVSISP
eukprot:COSAG01_NODE_326_length_18790_cov_10.366005_9_plen_267_part_00